MITSDQVQALRMMLGSQGWVEVLKPYMQQRGRALMRELIASQSERSEQYKGLPDDVIRGQIRALEEILAWTANQIQAHDHNRRLDELDAATNGAESDSRLSMANP